ncbi:LLM class flavin-dependent oxidoreductase [Robertmurraya yapensis]|uniref:LLM class flavin-dependent oxidoreductase n=2 Tax=Bacillaceae TaxID=186817 RepID=A0A3S0KBN9_9BACI|nr:LLM class flavin-dependent oxidoreductase [Bacillus yapensis]RTR27141.1 LLM class flavin-dependent oxidoreductase [Bacillus yapensis]TKS93988.1 MsnO8 family LLM class oxidoreductase [Bacillus yapensis]
MKLSILDQAPISKNQTPQEALQASMKLAQAAEELGYTRFWVAEHHDLPGLASSAPEVILGYIGANTNKIRIGSGAVLLPHYKPYKIAEVYNMLATLFPDRIDVGIGRAPGGSAEATEALNDQFLQQVWNMPSLVEELLHFLHRDFPSDHKFAKLTAAPVPEVPPVPWLLGTSKKSALLAAKNGMAYAFGQFMSDNVGSEIIQEYRKNFQRRSPEHSPSVLLTVSAYCAETTEKAHEIALSSLIWSISKGRGEASGVPSIEEAKDYPLSEKEKEQLEIMKRNMIIGTPSEVKERLIQMKDQYNVDEIMIVTITYSPEDKIQSYRLIAKEIRDK